MRLKQIHPQAIRTIFETFNSEEENDIQLLKAMENVIPAGDASSVIPVIVDMVPGIAFEKVESVTDAFAYLYMCFESLIDKPITLASFIDSVSERAAELVDNLRPESLLMARTCLEHFLNAKTNFGIAVKANNLLTHNQRNFSRIRIISDLRPMFEAENPLGEPTAFLIAHSMKISYTSDGKDKSMMIGLDTGELLEIKECVERALSKTQSLKDFAKRVGATMIEVECAARTVGT